MIQIVNGGQRVLIISVYQRVLRMCYFCSIINRESRKSYGPVIVVFDVLLLSTITTNTTSYFCSFPSSNATPVSYTHLDVYKRQQHSTGRTDRAHFAYRQARRVRAERDQTYPPYRETANARQ